MTLSFTEPSLDDLLNEPIIRQLMASDGYTSEDIRSLFEGKRQPLFLLSDEDDPKMTQLPAHICEAAMHAAKACCRR